MTIRDLTFEDVRKSLDIEIEIAFSKDRSGKRKRLVYNPFQSVYRIYLDGNVIERFGGIYIDKAVDFYNAM